MIRYIAIDGPGGAGKTYVSNLLSQQLESSVLHLDEYGDDYRPFVGIPKLVEAIKEDHSSIIIYEGVGVFKPQFDQFRPIRIFVNTEDDIRQKRAMKRDAPTAERSNEEWKKIYKIWADVEKEYFTDLVIKTADIYIDNGKELDIHTVIKQIQQLWGKK